MQRPGQGLTPDDGPRKAIGHDHMGNIDQTMDHDQAVGRHLMVMSLWDQAMSCDLVMGRDLMMGRDPMLGFKPGVWS